MAEYEALYTVERRGQLYYIMGYTERKAAERFSIRHLTVIIVPFITDGADKGKWIVHDRTAKLWAKEKSDCLSPSYNLFGGHCTPKTFDLALVGQEIPMEICVESAKRELNEELLCAGNDKELEIWVDKVKTDQVVNAAHYPTNELISIGWTSYTHKENVELSYIFALPVRSADIERLIAADNYKKDGEERDVFLPIKVFAEEELHGIWQTDPSIEICDAIMRLWHAENESVLHKLRETIKANT